MGCNVSPEILILNKPILKNYKSSLRYANTEDNNIIISEKISNNINKSIDNIRSHYIIKI
jgi:hypothetical protein